MCLLTTELVTVKLVQPGLILLKSHSFIGVSRDPIVMNVDNLETWGIETKCYSSKLDQSINDVLKDKNST